MRRYKKTSGDVEGILAVINNFVPATQHFSWSVLDADGNRAHGTYFSIGKFRVAKELWDKILAENSITMAAHARVSYRNAFRPKYFGECLIKSRFGETRVLRNLGGGGVRECDNPEAKLFYDEQNAKSLERFGDVLDNDGLEAAKAEKKRQLSTGEMI